MPSQIDLNKVKEDIINVAIEKELVFQAKFVNVTPWWGMGPLNQVVYDYKGDFYISMPSVSTLIGKMRWLLRSAFASYTKNIDDAERLINSLLGGIERSSKYRINIELNINDLRRWSIKALYLNEENIRLFSNYLRQIVKNKCGYNIDKKCLNKVIQEIEKTAYKLMCNKDTSFRLVDKKIIDVIKLFAISRIRLKLQEIPKIVIKQNTYSRLNDVVQKITEFIYQYQPIKPLFLRFSLKIYSHGIDQKPIEDYIVVLSAIGSLSILGIGSGANRGFGRFIPIDLDFAGIRDNDLNNKIKEIINGYKNVNISKIEQLPEYMLLQELDNTVQEYLGSSKNTELAPFIKLSLTLEFLKQYATKLMITDIKHPSHAFRTTSPQSKEGGLYNTGSPEYILSAIGRAVIKNTWKEYHRSYSKPSIAYHTWVLGLPRNMKSTGYLLFDEYFDDKWVTSKDMPKYSIPRRQSMLVLSPICRIVGTKALCKSVLVLPFISSDVLAWLSEEKGPYLEHVGKHQKGKRINYRIVSVLHAGQSMGVQYPDKNQLVAEPLDLVNKAIEAAIDWINKLLSRR